MKSNLLLLLLAAPVFAAAQAVPHPALAPAADEQHLLTVAAHGVQIYECRAAGWTFVAPDAVLIGHHGKPIGRHGAGPYWQASDGSRVTGSVKSRVDAPTAGAVPWLLLGARSDGTPGLFAGVTSIQRVNTEGGLAPTVACNAACIGTVARVPYRADYHLYQNALLAQQDDPS
jgi:hypothetical protein